VILTAALSLAIALGVLSSRAGAADVFVDAVLAQVETRALTASDIALARALGLFGFTPSTDAIGVADVDRAVGVWIVVIEAQRLRLSAVGEGRAEAWRAASDRFGGPPAFEAWLTQVGVEPEWARQLVEDDLDWRQFIDLRFRAFAFVTEDQVREGLGAEPDTPEARARIRATLEAAEVEERLGEWLAEERRRVAVHVLLATSESVSVPFSMPTLPPPPAPQP
jgi:hypothetical protein